MAKKKSTIVPGDVFVGQVPDGRYGALRVLRIVDRTFLVYPCDYLEATPPLLTDPALMKPVINNRFSWEGQSAMFWTRGKVPAGLTLLGNVPLTKVEEKVDSNVFGYWDENTVHEAYLEWRWVHDREAFIRESKLEREQRDREAQQQALQQKPKKMMSEDDFWGIIGLLDWSKTGDDEQVMQPAVVALAKLGKKAIHAFEERLSYLLYQLDTKAHAKHIGSESYTEPDGYISGDWFLYVRCAAVANGKAFYDSALKSPENMPKDVEFEALLGLANTAHQLRYDDEMDYQTGCNRESFSNLLGWEKA